MRKKDDVFKLTREQKEYAITKIKEYFLDNFDMDVGNLQTELLIDFISENLGVYYYNKAIADSLSFMTEKAEDIYLLMKEEKH